MNNAGIFPQAMSEEQRLQRAAWLKARIPLGRQGTPDDIAKGRLPRIAGV